MMAIMEEGVKVATSTMYDDAATRPCEVGTADCAGVS